MRVTRHFVTVGANRQVHYRRVGAGPPVLLVHESPMTGLMLLPLARQLAELGYTAIALDTPGYGGSDSLPGLPLPSIADYADAVLETADALGLDRPHLYGSHTGAQIALEAGYRHPGRLGSVVIDGLPAFTRGESVDLGRNWLVTYPPLRDGTHLLALWHRYRDHVMFFPWYRLEGSERLELDMPDARHLHERHVDWLLPGTDYTPSYHAAFAYDGHLELERLQARAVLSAHDRDLLGFFMDRLPAQLGPNTVKARMPKAEHARWIADFLAGGPRPDAPPAPASVPIEGRLTRTYADADGVQLLVRCCPGDGAATVLVPEPPDTGSGLVAALAESARAAYAVDLPGTGGSDALPAGDPELEDFARTLVAAVRTLGLEQVDLAAPGLLGSAFAEAAADADPELARSLAVADPSERPPAELCARIAAHPRVDLEPRSDGGHLIAAWTAIRDREAFLPWFDRTIPAMLRRDMPHASEMHRRVLEVLKALDTWDLAERAACRALAGAGRQ